MASFKVAPIMRSLLVNSSRACMRTATINCYNTNKIFVQPSPTLTSSEAPILSAHNYLETARLLHTTSVRFDIDANATETDEAQSDNSASIRSHFESFEKDFTFFVERAQRTEKVVEKDYVKIFDHFTKLVEELEAIDAMKRDNVKVNLSIFTGTLLRCCGKLMYETPEKVRELLAGNLWQFTKEKKIPLDITHYNSLIRVLNENQTVFDPQNLLDEISATDLTPDRVTYQRLIHQYCTQGDISGATRLLETMKSLDMPLNERLFASLIVGYSKQETPPTMTEMFELMKSNGVEPESCSIAAAIVTLAKRMEKEPEKASEELEKIVEMVQSENTHFENHDLVEILNALSPLKENEKVSKLWRHLVESNHGLNLRVRIYSILIKLGEYEEVARLYRSQTVGRKPSASGNESTYEGAVIGRILSQLAEQGMDPALLEKMYNACKIPGQRPNTRTATPVIKAHLLNGDFNGALDLFARIANESQITPCKTELIGLCLEKKDADSLQKIMDISNKIHGENNSLFDLAVCCLTAGKTKQAQKIFANPGFRVNPRRVYNTAEKLALNNDIAALENFVQLARDMYDINQEQLFQILINAYENSSSGNRALDLWNRMQEEEFQPSKKILLMIAKILEKSNLRVPFLKPRKLEHRNRVEHVSD